MGTVVELGSLEIRDAQMLSKSSFDKETSTISMQFH